MVSTVSLNLLNIPVRQVLSPIHPLSQVENRILEGVMKGPAPISLAEPGLDPGPARSKASLYFTQVVLLYSAPDHGCRRLGL